MKNRWIFYNIRACYTTTTTSTDNYNKSTDIAT